MLVAAAFTAAPLAAQSALVAEGIRSGQVGERSDGYMGFAATPSQGLRRQVETINIERRNLYTGLAGRREVTTDFVGRATACQLFAQLTAGEAYLLDDGVWRRYAAGHAAPVPAQCR
jgi:hypothetical protein